MTTQEFIEKYDKLMEEYTKKGDFEEIRKLKEKFGKKYNAYKRELQGISQEDFIKDSIEKKKKDLLGKIKK
jgi:hypothetical protein